MIRFSPEAEADLLSIVETIVADNGLAVARRVHDQIRSALLSPNSFPMMVRAGRVEGTRELAVAGLPYIIIYEVEPGGVLVVAVVHGAMQWPPGGV